MQDKKSQVDAETCLFSVALVHYSTFCNIWKYNYISTESTESFDKIIVFHRLIHKFPHWNKVID